MFSCSPGLSALNLGVWSPLWKHARTLVAVWTPLRLTGGTGRDSERETVCCHHLLGMADAFIGMLWFYWKHIINQSIRWFWKVSWWITCARAHTYVLSRVQLCVTPWTVSYQYSGNASDFQLSTIGPQGLSSAFCILAQIALPSLFLFWYWVM